MDRDRIREIVRLAQESPVAELRIREGEVEVRVLKGAPPPPAHGSDEIAAPGTAAMVRASDRVIIRATKVGFFHRGKGPGAPPLVSVGDRVQAGQALGTLEALRKLADVAADVPGEILAILVEDGSAVEYGQALFEIRAEQGADEHGVF